MHKHLLLPLLAVAVFASVSFSSCQETMDVAPVATSPAPAPSPEAQAQAFLRGNHMPTILFQYAERDAATDELRGFIIDNQGLIRTYSLENTPYEYGQYQISRLPASLLRRLYDASQPTTDRVDLANLAQRVRIITRERNQQLRTGALNGAAIVTKAYYAYSYLAEEERNDPTAYGCNSGTQAQPGETEFLLVPLHVEGKVNTTNTTSFVVETVDWLHGLVISHIPQ